MDEPDELNECSIILKTFISEHTFICDQCGGRFEQVWEVDHENFCPDCFDTLIMKEGEQTEGEKE